MLREKQKDQAKVKSDAINYLKSLFDFGKPLRKGEQQPLGSRVNNHHNTDRP